MSGTGRNRLVARRLKTMTAESMTMIEESVAQGTQEAQQGSRPRLAVVISHPIQHFVPLFVRLASTAAVELKVFYCCDWGVREYRDPGFGTSFAWDIPMLDGYEHEFLPIRKRPESLRFFEIDNPRVGERLSDFSPDAVWIHGYSHCTSWRVMRWARGRSRVLYFGDSELLSARGPASKLVKRLVLPWFFRRCDGFLTIGDNNETYYRHYGVPDTKMFRGSFPIDLSRFQGAISQIDETQRRMLRCELGLSPDAVVALFVGKLISIKRPLDFVDAIAKARRVQPNIEGLIVGSGPMEKEVRDRIEAHGLSKKIRMTGFVNQSQIPSMLRLGDILAMCSEKDPHPLAVSEAMAAGNAVVASNRVGCVGPTDAARPGRNAIVFPCGNVEALADCMRNLVVDTARRQEMQAESRRLAETQSVDVCAEGIVRFLNSRVSVERSH